MTQYKLESSRANLLPSELSRAGSYLLGLSYGAQSNAFPMATRYHLAAKGQKATNVHLMNNCKEQSGVSETGLVSKPVWTSRNHAKVFHVSLASNPTNNPTLGEPVLVGFLRKFKGC